MERDGPGSPLSALTNPGSSLFQRIAAILVLAPVALAIIWFGGRPFSALIAFICILLVFEWARIVDRVEFSNAFYLLSFTAILSIFLTAGGDYRDAFLVSLGGGRDWCHPGEALKPALRLASCRCNLSDHPV